MPRTGQRLSEQSRTTPWLQDASCCEFSRNTWGLFTELPGSGRRVELGVRAARLAFDDPRLGPCAEALELGGGRLSGAPAETQRKPARSGEGAGGGSRGLQGGADLRPARGEDRGPLERMQRGRGISPFCVDGHRTRAPPT